MNFTSRSLLRTLAACSLAGLFSAAVPTGARAAGDAPLDAVLAASRTALGIDAAGGRVHTIVERGAMNVAGIAGTGEQWIDLGTGTFAQFADVGPLSQAGGFDGQHSWTRDRTGIVWDDGRADTRYTNQDAVYLNRYALWAPDRGGASVLLEPQKTEGAVAYDVVRVTPPGGLAFDVWIDRKTHLPARVIQPVGLTTTTSTFADYRPVDGLQVPFEQNTSTDQGGFSLKVTSAVANPPDVVAHLARPESSAHDFAISPGTSTSVPFDLIDNHVYVNVMLNGKGPFRFVFDTGGDYLLDTDVAKSLGITGKGQVQGGGVGAATEAFSFAKVDTLAVGNATIRDQTFLIVPVRAGFGVGGGSPVDGLIGFGVLARFLTTYDYDHRQVVLAMPGTGTPPAAGAVSFPFVFQGTTPMIDCSIGGFPGSCTVDTGSRSSLSVTSPFAAAHPSLVPANATAVGVNGFGVGGAASGRLGRTTLAFGSLSFPNTIADFSTQKGGAFADPFTAGNIGGGIWKRFAVTFDYPRQSMTMVPNANGPTADDYDRSGLFLIHTAAGIVVADSRPGTPAAAAGFTRGQTLVSIDGHTASTMSLAELRDLFMAKPGTLYHVVVKNKDGTSKTLELTLRNYV